MKVLERTQVFSVAYLIARMRLTISLAEGPIRPATGGTERSWRVLGDVPIYLQKRSVVLRTAGWRIGLNGTAEGGIRRSALNPVAAGEGGDGI